jgi:hypothetical protein
MPRERATNRLDIVLSDAVEALFADLQESVKKAGHSKPTPRTLVSALIFNENRRVVLVPFRLQHPDHD